MMHGLLELGCALGIVGLTALCVWGVARSAPPNYDDDEEG